MQKKQINLIWFLCLFVCFFVAVQKSELMCANTENTQTKTKQNTKQNKIKAKTKIKNKNKNTKNRKLIEGQPMKIY